MGEYAFAEGLVTKASGEASHSEGYETTAYGDYSHAEGWTTHAKGYASHAEGDNTTAFGDCSHAEGYETIASGYSHAEGSNTTASGGFSHAEGYATIAFGDCSHTEGNDTRTGIYGYYFNGDYSNNTITVIKSNDNIINYAIDDIISIIYNDKLYHRCSRIISIENNLITVNRLPPDMYPDGSKFLYVESKSNYGDILIRGDYSHAEGNDTKAFGLCSHSEGGTTTASGNYSHAEGYETAASGYASHAEGETTTASGLCSHAEGYDTTALGRFSHAEGWTSCASGDFSHAEGFDTAASGLCSHAEGESTIASGRFSHASGLWTIASNSFQYVIGKYNSTLNNGLFVIGNGSDDDDSLRSNAFRVTESGETYAMGSYNSTGADYSEYFEWSDGNPDNEIRTGRFVTMTGKKIKLATSIDDYIIGVVTANASIVGNSYEDSWNGRFMTDVYGNLLYEDKTDDEGNVTTWFKQNPDYDPSQKYIPRSQRPEWSTVGMLGQLVVDDDGTCEVDGYCKPNNNGIATKADSGYRVIDRIDENHILIIFK